MVNVYFIADLHFFHRNICKYTDRAKVMGLDEENPNIGEMNEWIINMWNSIVQRQDIVYILGDFSFINTEETRKLLERLKGHKHLIWGNHDKSCRGLENYFESTSDIRTVVFKQQNYSFLKEDFVIQMCHYPLLAWDRRMHGCCMVHGHTHGAIDQMNEESRELRVDVGLDAKLANYSLVSLERLYEHFRGISSGMRLSDYIKAKSEEDGIGY